MTRYKNIFSNFFCQIFNRFEIQKQEIKQLQDENINLKLRIYLLEEKTKNTKLNDYDSALVTISNDELFFLNEKVIFNKQ